MKKKIGVMGSAKGFLDDLRKKAREIGGEIAKNGCVLITGATTGLPYEAAKGAKEENGLVVGISPATNLEEHKNKYKFPTDSVDAIVFTGFGIKGRNVINIRSSDGVIFLSGGVGTLNEFTNAYGEGKVIGILEGSGGISDEIRNLEKSLYNDFGSKIIYDEDPKKLVERVLEALE